MNTVTLGVFILLAELNLGSFSLLPKGCPEKCDITYDPVCASNGKTYKNMCRLERENCFAKTEIVELYKGECLRSEDDEIEDERRPYGCLRVGRGKYLTC